MLGLLVVLLTGCDVLGGRETLTLDSAEVELPRGAEIHDVMVGGAGATDTVAPATTAASPGDAVRFVATDHRTHALVFDGDSLDPAARQFLERTVQLRGPPLVNEGAAWVVNLADAPPGRYPFFCRSHEVRGVLSVGDQD